MASVASSYPSIDNFFVSSGIPPFIASIFNGTPITTVEATNT